MLTDSQIEAAHPEAFDFVFGNLRSAEGVKFIRHLIGCLHCRAVVDEYSEIGEFVKLLPPHVEPSADLEDRTVAAMVRVLTGQRAKTDRRTDTADHTVTRVYPISQRRFPKQAEPETWVQPSPEVHHRAAPKTPFPQSPDSPPAPPETQTHATVIALPLWRRHSRRVSAVVGVAAAVIIAAAIVIPLRAGGGSPAQTSVAIPLHATAAAKVSGYAAATGQATIRPDASGSWNVTLTVHHLRNFGDAQWYQCWYLSRDRQKVASAGTFLVPESGSGSFSMTSAGYPDDFPTMEITLGPPSKNGALAGPVILSGHAL